MLHIPKTDAEKVAIELGVPYANVALIGSQFITDKVGSDTDFLVLATDERVTKQGYVSDLQELEYPPDFQSYRKGRINLVVTQDRGFFLTEYAIACAARLVFQRQKLGIPLEDMTVREGRVEFHGFLRQAVQPYLQYVVESEPEPEDIPWETT